MGMKEILRNAYGMGYDCRIVGCKQAGEWVFELYESDDLSSETFVGEEGRFVSHFICNPLLYTNDSLMIASGFPKDPAVLGSLGNILYEIRNEMKNK